MIKIKKNYIILVSIMFLAFFVVQLTPVKARTFDTNITLTKGYSNAICPPRCRAFAYYSESSHKAISFCSAYRGTAIATQEILGKFTPSSTGVYVFKLVHSLRGVFVSHGSSRVYSHIYVKLVDDRSGYSIISVFPFYRYLPNFNDPFYEIREDFTNYFQVFLTAHEKYTLKMYFHSYISPNDNNAWGHIDYYYGEGGGSWRRGWTIYSVSVNTR